MNYLQRLLPALTFLVINSANAQFWQQISDFPSTERDDGIAFTIANKAYCGTGLNQWFSSCNDFYSLDMNTDAWDTIAPMQAGEERQYACGFSSPDAGFVFGGINGSTYLNDVWKYDPVLNTWEEKTALPAEGRGGSSVFVINNIAYLIGGRTVSTDAIEEVWAYDLINDVWEHKSNLPFGARWRAAATVCADKGYIIFGKDQSNRFCSELMEYNPSGDNWTQISTFPGTGRTYSALACISDDLVITTGLDTAETSYNDMWRFDFSASQWQQLNTIPANGRRGGMCFNNGSAIYYTAGIDQSNTRIKQTWKCENPTGISAIKVSDIIKLYPNPTSENITIELSEFKTGQLTSYSLCDVTGKILCTGNINKNKILVNLSPYSAGIYFIKVTAKNIIVTQRIFLL